ncbi:unnamed protein product [Spirodela intermedia]|uniref:Uncharacterized protein n=1 Tax=Spirodela intermedia TaxID=51605 RepID=A0A7I8JCL7_SPIIN|nr:unnamed protein product [Spirodela intermedia]CAA6667465.1 unnamed protein product [Spirodela intermedia]
MGSLSCPEGGERRKDEHQRRGLGGEPPRPHDGPVFCKPAAAPPSPTGNLHPLVLIPGDGEPAGGPYYKDYKPSSLVCKWWTRQPAAEGGGGGTVSGSTPSSFSPFTRCFSSTTTGNAPGVETRVPGFGSTEALRYLDPSLRHLTDYMGTLVKSLEEEIGYEEGKSSLGAPYDFRYGLAAEGRPCKVGEGYLRDLKELSSRTPQSPTPAGPPFSFAHSLGTLSCSSLSLENSPSGRRPVHQAPGGCRAAVGGAVVQMLTFASGSTLGIPIVDPLLVRAEQRTSESNMWLLPAPRVFKNQPLVVDPREELLRHGHGGVPPGHWLRRRRPPLPDPDPAAGGELPAMEVPVTCVLGTGVKTPETLVYGEGGFDAQPEVVYGDGDGTVNLASLVALEAEWSGKTSQPVKLLTVPGASHSDVLKDRAAVGEIIREIAAINSLSLNGSAKRSNI